MINASDYLPNGFYLRSGAGGGDPASGMCFMETAAFIAGEQVTDRPKCACPVLTSYGIVMNDQMPDKKRQELIGLAWSIAGTKSPEHEQERLKILGLAACDIAEKVAHLNTDPRVMAAIDAARLYWQEPTDANKKAAYAAARAAAGAAAAKAAKAAYAAYAAYAAARAADAAAKAAARAAAGAAAAGAAARLAGPDTWDMAIDALRRAIQVGPHGGVETSDMVSRINAQIDILPVRKSEAAKCR